jgi:hypothetical protein
MTPRPLSPEKFREEANRRLIDTWGLMLRLNLRSKQAVWNRVAQGKLPEPVLTIPNTVALWDLDEIPA